MWRCGGLSTLDVVWCTHGQEAGDGALHGGEVAGQDGPDGGGHHAGGRGDGPAVQHGLLGLYMAISLNFQVLSILKKRLLLVAESSQFIPSTPRQLRTPGSNFLVRGTIVKVNAKIKLGCRRVSLDY